MMRMAENQSQHRVEIMKSVIKAADRKRTRDQWMGIVLRLMALSASVYLGADE